MPKAHINKPDGTKIEIEGTAAEIKEILGLLDRGQKHVLSSPVTPQSPPKAIRKRKTGTDVILELKETDFFSKPKTLLDIKKKLAEFGLIYPTTSLSGMLLALVKRRQLGRMDQDKKWSYVNR